MRRVPENILNMNVKGKHPRGRLKSKLEQQVKKDVIKKKEGHEGEISGAV